MSDLKGVKINKGATGPNTADAGDKPSMMIIAAPAATGLAHNVIKTVYNMSDVKALGFTQANDLAGFANSHRHLREFYRIAGEGTPLLLMLVPQAQTLVDILTDSEEGANDSAAKLLIAEGEGNFYQMAIATNPVVAPVALNGLSEDVYNAIPLAQGVKDWAFNNHMPLNILLEGRDYAGPGAAAANLKAIEDVNADGVSVVIGQDYKYADTLPTVDGATPVYMRTLADVGTALGTVSAARVNQNIGDNEAFNLTDSTVDAWMVAGLSNHQTTKSQINDLQTLEDKGYIFGTKYPPMAGYRWNGDHTCIETVVDAEGNINLHTISYSRTHDKAVRKLREAYLPKVKTTHPVDPATGKLPTGVLKYFEGIGNDVFGDMEIRNEISAGQVIVDPNSDLVVEKLLKIERFTLVPYGYANAIEGNINIKRSL